ncbi:MAG: FctA domain-containing protein [Clostridia bacterium]|nr:FctA domain-containing protein [Clostridia bacterium]
MKSKTLRCIVAVVMAGSMMTAISTAAMAEDQVSLPKNATITKSITKDAYDYAPNTDFSFTITPGSAVPAGNGQDAIFAGIKGGAYFAEGKGAIHFSPDAADIGNTKITANTDISVDSSKFEEPGIYRYVVKETTGNYDGITYSSDEKYFDVYVNADGEVYAYQFTDKDTQQEKDDGNFTNNYDVKDLTITKNVEGNQGNKSKEFNFTINVEGDKGENYYVTFSGTKKPVTLQGSALSITLKNGESATIHGLSSNDAYTVTEDDYSNDGYVTSIGDKRTNEAKGTISEDSEVIFKNTRNAATPTGIVMSIAPYIIMILAAGVFAVVFLRRKRYFKR